MRFSAPVYMASLFMTLVTIIYAFEPSNEWQSIPNDVAIPPGLHVRLDLESGLREAKLVDTNDQETEDNHNKEIAVQAPLPVGPQDSENDILNNALGAIRARTVTDQQLDNLSDLAHDREFGLEITDKVGSHLLDIILSSHTLKSTKEVAARVFGAALRNNPAALQSVFSLDHRIVPKVLNVIDSESDSKIASRLIYVLSSLMGQAEGIKGFVDHNGGDALAKAYDLSADAKLKCINFVRDYLLSEDSEAMDISISWRSKELQRWADLFQKDLIGKVPAGLKLTLLETLASMKALPGSSILVGDQFMNWISQQAIKTADKHASEDEKDLISYVKQVRHLLFGNPKAARKQFDDL